VKDCCDERRPTIYCGYSAVNDIADFIRNDITHTIPLPLPQNSYNFLASLAFIHRETEDLRCRLDVEDSCEPVLLQRLNARIPSNPRV
jgi:hypothetical protein